MLVNLSDLVPEVKARLERKARLDSLAIAAEGLRVVGGLKQEESQKAEESVQDAEKATEEMPLSQEAIGAVPAS